MLAAVIKMAMPMANAFFNFMVFFLSQLPSYGYRAAF